MDRLLIIGAGGFGRMLAETVQSMSHYDLIGFLDDSTADIQNAFGYPVLGTTENLASYLHHATNAIVAIGNNALRKELSQNLITAGFKLITVIHPAAIISPSAIIGAGSIIMAGAVISTEAILGSGVIINSGAVVDHNVQIHDYAHLSVNASMAGGSVLGRQGWLQAGSTVGSSVIVHDGFILKPGLGIF